jgi:hypothetical protein
VIHVYFCSQLEDGAVRTIGRSESTIHITRTKDGAPSGCYRFGVGDALDTLRAAVCGAGATAKSKRRLVANIPMSSGAETTVAYRSGAVLLSRTMPDGALGHVTVIEGEELRWLARASSDLTRMSARMGQNRKRITA